MKAIKQFMVLIVIVLICVFVYRHYKPEIVDFLNDKGINVPGITDNTQLFPTTDKITDQNGNSSVVVNIPSMYTENVTPDMINTIQQSSDGRLVVSTQEDGSIDLTMTPEYQAQIINEVSNYFDQTVLAEMISGNVTAINHNEYYSVFTVTCTPGMQENDYLTLAGKLFAAGKAYSSLSGLSGDSILVVFVSSETGEVTNSYRSDNIAEGLASDVTGIAEDLVDRAVGNLFS
ncbi:MAG: hypothetical protein J6127_08540 [Clostridiales bacterium]|nr:hypothetical protein [Clostridiales bacterium]